MGNPFRDYEAFSGSYAKIYEGGQWLAQFHSITATVNKTYIDVPQSGKVNNGKKFNGFEIPGTMTGAQYDSSFIKRLSADKDPSVAPLSLNLLLVNDDPAVRSPYKVMLKNVKFTTIPLFVGEHGNLVENTFEFFADDYEIIEE